jgi:hypothetical protein
VHCGKPPCRGTIDPLRDLPAGLSQVRGRLASTASTPTRTTARLGGFTPT